MVKKSLEDITVRSENCAKGECVGGTKQELTSMTIENDKLDSTLSEKADELGKEWICGDVIWARFSGQPFWPGIITIDPNNCLFVKTRKGRGESTSQVYHVQYYGDRGRHSWVSANHILKYEGETKLREVVLMKKKEKDKKYLGAVPDPKASSAFKWQCAVKEADDALLATRQDRLIFFEECFPVMIVSKGKGSKDVEVKKKKEKMNKEEKKDSPSIHPSSSGISTKCVDDDKTNGEKTCSKKEDGKAVLSPNKQEQGGEPKTASNSEEKLDLNAPSTSTEKKRTRSENDDTVKVSSGRTKRARLDNSSTSGMKNGKKKQIKNKRDDGKSKLQYKKKHKDEPGDFEAFLKKSTEHFIEKNPKFADDEVALRESALKMWEVMNDSEKSKFPKFIPMRS